MTPKVALCETRTWSGTLSRRAECEDCGWTLDAKNAIGVAAQHARRYGHKVRVEIESFVRFEPTG